MTLRDRLYLYLEYRLYTDLAHCPRLVKYAVLLYEYKKKVMKGFAWQIDECKAELM